MLIEIFIINKWINRLVISLTFFKFKRSSFDFKPKEEARTKIYLITKYLPIKFKQSDDKNCKLYNLEQLNQKT